MLGRGPHCSGISRVRRASGSRTLRQGSGRGASGVARQFSRCGAAGGRAQAMQPAWPCTAAAQRTSRGRANQTPPRAAAAAAARASSGQQGTASCLARRGPQPAPPRRLQSSEQGGVAAGSVGPLARRQQRAHWPALPAVPASAAAACRAHPLEPGPEGGILPEPLIEVRIGERVLPLGANGCCDHQATCGSGRMGGGSARAAAVLSACEYLLMVAAPVRQRQAPVAVQQASSPRTNRALLPTRDAEATAACVAAAALGHIGARAELALAQDGLTWPARV